MNVSRQRKNAAYGVMPKSQREGACEVDAVEKRHHRQKMEAWQDQRVCELEKYKELLDQPHKCYQQVNRMKLCTCRRLTCRDKEANQISNHMGILERSNECFDELLNNNNVGELEVPQIEEDRPTFAPSNKETVRPIHRLIIICQEWMELKSNWVDEATIYTKRFIDLCLKFGIANECLMTSNKALSVPNIKKEYHKVQLLSKYRVPDYHL